MKALQGKTLSTLLAAEKEGDHRTVLLAVREARGNIELLGKLLGKLDEPAAAPVNVFVNHPEWATIRTTIVVTLRPYPEALRALTAALREVGSGP